MLFWKTEYHTHITPDGEHMPDITGWYLVGRNESNQVAQLIGPYITREAADIDAPSAIGG